MGRIAEAVVEHTEIVQAQRSGALVLVDAIKRKEAEFAAALPAHVDPKRFVRAGLSMLNTVDKIQQCTTASVVTGLMQAAQLGLEVSDVRGQAFLIPRWSSKRGRMEAVFQLGYHGMIDLAARAGITVDVETVRVGDEFEYRLGTDPFLDHHPPLGVPGEAIAYYAVGHFADGRRSRFVVWSKERVELHRDRFASSKKKNGEVYGPWVDHFDGMAKKTVIRDLLDTLPMQVETKDALFRDAAGSGEIEPTAGQQAELDATAAVDESDISDAEIVDCEGQEALALAVDDGGVQ